MIFLFFVFFFFFFDKQLKRTFIDLKQLSNWLHHAVCIWFPIIEGLSSTQTMHTSTRLACGASKCAALLLPLLMWEAFHQLNCLREISMPSVTFLIELGVGPSPLNAFIIISESLSTMISLSPRSQGNCITNFIPVYT